MSKSKSTRQVFVKGDRVQILPACGDCRKLGHVCPRHREIPPLDL